MESALHGVKEVTKQKHDEATQLTFSFCKN